MAWVRVDDQAPRNEKMLKAGPAACWLWVCGIAHCQSQLTDGFISEQALPMIGVVHRVRSLAAQLVAAGLFEAVDGGFRVHDYLVHNESGVEAKARRDHLTEERRKAGHLGGVRRQANLKQTASKPQANASSNLQAPSHPIPSEEKKQPTAVQPKEPADPHVKEFLTWFQSEYTTRRAGAVYLVKWAKHGALVKAMLHAGPLEKLQKFAQIMLSEKCEDEFIVASDRGIEVLSAKFSWLSDRLAAWEARRRA